MTIPTADFIAEELADTLVRMRFFADKVSDIDHVEILALDPVLRDNPNSPDVDIALVRCTPPIPHRPISCPSLGRRTSPRATSSPYWFAPRASSATTL